MVGETAAAAPTFTSSPAAGDFVIRHWMSSPSASTDHTSLRRRPATRPSSLEVVVVASNGAGDFDDFASRSPAEEGKRTGGYISLRDILDSPPPAPPHDGARSPTTPTSSGAPGEIRIRNRLVKQAAYAYLHPAPSAAESDRTHRRRALCRALAIVTCGLAAGPILGCVDFLRQLFCCGQRRRRLF
ncbi:hypothetical protein Cni_G06025 [Canna indica]|uniref:Uncharacterized protein n=1 Tax=Canna indica TaxID=4628 RepID=A0AAQ3JW88_9LILI|nr:hypothetical protein Cni_G06025 [Canna indica]